MIHAPYMLFSFQCWSWYCHLFNAKVSSIRCS